MDEENFPKEAWQLCSSNQSSGQGRGRGSGLSAQCLGAGSAREEKRKDREDEWGERGRDVRRRVVHDPDSDLKVIIKFKESNDIRAVELVALTAGLKKACREIEMAKVAEVEDGNLLESN